MATPDEVVFDVANVLMGACVASILDEFGRKPVFFPPGLLGANVSFDDVFQPTELAWSVALLLEVNFEPRTTRSGYFVMLLMAEDSIRLMGDALDALLSAMTAATSSLSDLVIERVGFGLFVLDRAMNVLMWNRFMQASRPRT